MAHLLVGVFLLFLAWGVWINLQFSGLEDAPKVAAQAKILVFPGIISLFWIWLWMLTDYFRERPERGPIIWGWFLFIANIGAALLYFFAIWRPRHRPT